MQMAAPIRAHRTPGSGAAIQEVSHLGQIIQGTRQQAEVAAHSRSTRAEIILVAAARIPAAAVRVAEVSLVVAEAARTPAVVAADTQVEAVAVVDRIRAAVAVRTRAVVAEAAAITELR
jgi:hypothetical protein